MAVGDYLMLKTIGRCQSQNIVNSTCWETTAQGSSEAEVCASVCLAWEDTIKAPWLLAHADDYQLVGLKSYGLTGDPKVPGQLLIDEAGGVVADSLPAYVCRTITLYPEDISNKHRGRIMLSGTPADSITATDGGLSAAALALMDAIHTALMNGIGEGDDSFEMRIWGMDDAEPPVETAHPIIKAVSRRTPSSVTSRRIRELLIG